MSGVCLKPNEDVLSGEKGCESKSVCYGTYVQLSRIFVSVVKMCSVILSINGVCRSLGIKYCKIVSVLGVGQPSFRKSVVQIL